ncbi:RDD family protein [Lacibacter sp. H407]|uniref:RDD family protein n=1 Tax=Lacibacter sp. H407 TaxID=3133423 RepID=UPI0030BED193
MSNVQISTPFNISLDFEIAPFFKRLVAYFLDLMIMVAYAVFMRYFLYSGLQLEGESAMGIDILLVSVPLLLYHLVFEIIFHGQSLGKMAMGIRVMSMDGGDPAISQYLLRWFFRVWEWPLVFSFVYPGFWIIYQLIIVGMFGIIVIIIIAVTAKNQRLGDLAANTAIVNTRIQSSIHDTVFMEITQKDYQVKFPQVLKLSDRDINTIKTVLNQSYKRNNFETAHRIAGRIKTVLGIESDMEVDLFLEQLIADYNYLATRE